VKSLMAHLIRAYPNHSFAVRKSRWYHHDFTMESRHTLSFEGSIHPGFDGRPCNVFNAWTMDELASQMEQAYQESLAAARERAREKHEAQGGIELTDYATPDPNEKPNDTPAQP